jgi:hypothetical protein
VHAGVHACGPSVGVYTFAAERGDKGGAAFGGAALGSARPELRVPLDGG